MKSTDRNKSRLNNQVKFGKCPACNSLSINEDGTCIDCRATNETMRALTKPGGEIMTQVKIIQHGRGEIAIIDPANHEAGPLWVGQQSELIEVVARMPAGPLRALLNQVEPAALLDFEPDNQLDMPS